MGNNTKVKLTTTAKRDYKIEGMYFGTIKYHVPTNGKLLEVDYISDNPKNKMINLEFTIRGTSEKFEVKGLPADKPLDKLTSMQKFIVASTLPCIYGTVIKASTVSFAKTQLIRAADSDRDFFGEWELVLSKLQYELLFK